MLEGLRRPLLLTLGFLFLLLGFIGAFLPVMPTVPFMIVAAYCFSKSSKPLHEWLLRQPEVGPALRDWEENRVIRRRSKWAATAAISLSLPISLYFVNLALWIKITVAGVAGAVLVYVWLQKSETDSLSKKNLF